MKANDLVVIYRMTDGHGPARFRSVATSICTVEELKTRNAFKSVDEYLDYCIKYSVFDKEELMRWWSQYPRKPFFVIKLCYNAALASRITRGTLIDEVGLDENDRWGVLPLTDVQFDCICTLGKVDDLRIG